MGWVGRATWFVFSAVAGITAFLAQVGPDDAVSNVGKWASLLTSERLPIWLVSPAADDWFFYGGLTVFAVSLALAPFVWRQRKALIEQASKKVPEGADAIGTASNPLVIDYLPGEAPIHHVSQMFRDIPLFDAVSYVARATGNNIAAFERAASAIRQAALDGRLPFWGMKHVHNDGIAPEEREVYEPINTDYWRDGSIDLMPFIGEMIPSPMRSEDRTHGAPNDLSAITYLDLQTSLGGLRSLWPETPAMQVMKQTPDVYAILRDVGRLAEMLTSHAAFESQRNEAVERYQRLERSDSTVWLDPELKQLRRDFLNRCGIAIDCKKRYDTAADDRLIRSEIQGFADRIVALLTRGF